MRRGVTAVYPCLLGLLAGVAGRSARILPPPEVNTEPDVVLEAGYPGTTQFVRFHFRINIPHRLYYLLATIANCKQNSLCTLITEDDFFNTKFSRNESEGAWTQRCYLLCDPSKYFLLAAVNNGGAHFCMLGWDRVNGMTHLKWNIEESVRSKAWISYFSYFQLSPRGYAFFSLSSFLLIK